MFFFGCVKPLNINFRYILRQLVRLDLDRAQLLILSFFPSPIRSCASVHTERAESANQSGIQSTWKRLINMHDTTLLFKGSRYGVRLYNSFVTLEKISSQTRIHIHHIATYVNLCMLMYIHVYVLFRQKSETGRK